MTRTRALLLSLVPLLLFGCTKELTCPQGETDCGGRCAALQTAATDCGACGYACGAGVVCQAGACVCAPGTVSCAGGCFDLLTSPEHCGTGGTCAGAVACGGATPFCSAGACATSCGPGLDACGNACADLSADRDHCGTCSTACGPGASCVAGTCRSIQVACFSTSELRSVSPDLLFTGPARATGQGPISLALANGEVWSADSLDVTLSALPLDPTLPGATATLSGSDLEFVGQSAGLLFVSNSKGGTVIVYDPAGGRVLDEVPFTGQVNPFPHGIAFLNGRAFVALYGQDDVSDGQAVAVLDLSGVPGCAAADPSPPACGAGNSCPAGRVCRAGVCPLQCATLQKVIDLRAVPGSADAPGLPFPSRAVAAGSKVYVTLANMMKATSGPLAGYYVDPAGPSKLAVIDTAAADAVSIVPLPGCQDAGGLTALGTSLWVACADSSGPALVPVALSGTGPVPAAPVAPWGVPQPPVAFGAPGNIAFCGPMGYVTDLWSGTVLRFDPSAPSAAAQVAGAAVCPASAGPYGYAWAADVLCTP